MHDIGFTPRAITVRQTPAEMKKVLDASVTFGVKSPPVRLLMIVAFFQGVPDVGVLRLAAVLPRAAGTRRGVGGGRRLGADRLSMIAGNALVEVLTGVPGRRPLLLASSAVLAVAATGVGLVDLVLARVALLLVAIGATGVGAPVQQAYLHAVIPSSERATVVSFASLVGNAGGIGGQLGLGYLSRAQSVATAYVAGGLRRCCSPRQR